MCKLTFQILIQTCKASGFKILKALPFQNTGFSTKTATCAPPTSQAQVSAGALCASAAGDFVRGYLRLSASPAVDVEGEVGAVQADDVSLTLG